MRQLRWKRSYQSGDPHADRRGRAFIDCINSLIDAAGQREHCREMEEFVTGFSAEAELAVQNHRSDADLSTEFGLRLHAALPLSAYGSPACRQCGLCDLAQQKIAEHLDAPAQCLFKGT